MYMCMFMYMCVYIHIYVCIYLYINIWLHTHHTHTHTHIYMYIHRHTHMYLAIQMWWTKSSPRKANARRQSGCLRKSYKYLRKEEKWRWRRKGKIYLNEDLGNWCHDFMANRWGELGNSDRFYFLGLQNYCRWWLQPWIWRYLLFGERSYDKPRQCIEKQILLCWQRHLCGQSFDFSSSHLRKWELEHKEGWVLKNWCFWIVVLEVFGGPLDCKVIKPINLKGKELWIFIGSTDAEAETPILWPYNSKSLLIGKDSNSGKDWGQEEKGVTED